MHMCICAYATTIVVKTQQDMFDIYCSEFDNISTSESVPIS
jgi:hypothetical protein